MPYEYNATVTEVVDGDTIVIDLDLGFDIKFTNQKVRLLGIDTPESRTSDKVEKVFGLASKDFVKKFVAVCKNHVIIRTHISEGTDDSGREKFGRLLAEIINPDTKEVLNDQLISKNYAVKYMGENKLAVKDNHMANRKILIDRGDVKMDYKVAGLAG
jgi:micrococcal nuclease